ncbi:MAG: hypothetical protein WCR52_22070 [Bacteroidota bacterium]
MNIRVAKFFSFIGHPMLVLFYMLLLLMAVNPFAFGIRSMADPKAMVLIISVFAITILIPGIGVAIMKPLGLIKSLQMPDRQDRTGPYIVGGVFYLWLVKNLMSLGSTPPLFVKFAVGTTVCLFLAFFINIFIKVSVHGSGMGGLVTMVLCTIFAWPDAVLVISALGGTVVINLFVILVAVVILAGLVGVSRLALGAHSPVELALGYLLGCASALIGQVLV